MFFDYFILTSQSNKYIRLYDSTEIGEVKNLEKKLKYWTLQLLIILAIIYIATKVSFLFQPIGVFFSTIFAPLLITGFLFFIFNPVVKFMQKKLKLSRIISIIILYLAIITLIAIAIGSVIPMITKQITSLISDIPFYAKK